jgi:uncharacterized 2Fe-2S/4Fe-4S cluster protein (DUF4445 family)
MAYFEVKILPFGKEAKAEGGASLLEVLINSDVPIESVCGGRGKCGKCKVRVSPGDSASSLSPEENRLLKAQEIAQGMRLACMTRVRGDIACEVPESSMRKGYVRDKTRVLRAVEPDPAIRLVRVRVPEPSLSDPSSDLERIGVAMKEGLGLSIEAIDPYCFSYGPSLLRREGLEVNVVTWFEKEILGLQGRRKGEVYGLALDIGTTTIGGYLVNLRDGRILSSGSILNPQVRFGEDIMSRISYAVNARDGLRMLKAVLMDDINRLVQDLCEKAEVETDEIFEGTVVGNTVMHHLFLGIDPSALGAAPFVPFLRRGLDVKARDVGLKINPSGYVHLLPLEAAFVGADNVAVILALKPYLSEECVLIVDIGTNGEIVIGNKKRLISASCATGPALEGAHIKFGMRADVGAIERVRIDRESGEVWVNVIGGVKPKGICGSGVIDAVAELFKAGLIDGSGRFARGEMGDRWKDGPKGREFILCKAKDTSIGEDITITQEDIRNVQLAKAALYAGAKILIGHMGVEPSRVLLAGAFGMYIDVKNAFVLGMFPCAEPSRIVSVGNAAGEGAIFALLNRKQREEAEKIAEAVEYKELTLEKAFQREFIDALYIPHRKDPFPSLTDYL